MKKYLALVEPEALHQWLESKCELSRRDYKAFEKHGKLVYEKYNDLLRVVALHVRDEQQFIGASAMVIAVLECIEDSSKRAS
jgi:hypothetical protein